MAIFVIRGQVIALENLMFLSLFSWTLMLMKSLENIFIIFILFSCQVNTEKNDGNLDQSKFTNVLISYFGFHNRLEGIDTAYIDIFETSKEK